MKVVSQIRALTISSTLAVVAFFSHSVHATIFEYQFGDIFNGTIAPASTNSPYFTARFEDVSPGTVKLTLSVLSLTNTENVDELYFNLKPTFQPTSLNLAYQSGIGSFDIPTTETGSNQFKADGDGLYDL